MTQPDNKPVRVIHVDTNVEAIERLRQLLTNRSDIDYICSFTNPEEALNYLQEGACAQPDLIFVGSAVVGYNNFKLAVQIISSGAYMVLLTSWPQPPGSTVGQAQIGHLQVPVKAVKLDKLLLASKQYTHHLATSLELLQHHMASQQPQRIFVNMLGRIIVVHLKNVLCLVTTENYTNIIQADGTRLLSSKPLRIYAELLEHHPDFVRIHRSALVNRDYIQSILRDGQHHRYAVVLTNGEELPISYNKRDEIIQMLMQ